jgi:hypothetical protein
VGRPIFESIKGYPSDVDQADASTMKEAMADIAAFQGRIRAVRAQPLSQRMPAAKALADEACQRPTTAPTALAVVQLLKDSADTADDWVWLTNFVAQLPADIASLEEGRETNAFALANAGKPIEAIARLEELMTVSGPTPERLGLLVGRYKRLSMKAATPAERLTKASTPTSVAWRSISTNTIAPATSPDSISRGTARATGSGRSPSHKSWWRPAREPRNRKEADEWLRPTLLGAAFDAGDAEKAELRTG